MYSFVWFLIEVHQDLNFVTYILEFFLTLARENSISVDNTAEYGDLGIFANWVRFLDCQPTGFCPR